LFHDVAGYGQSRLNALPPGQWEYNTPAIIGLSYLRRLAVGQIKAGHDGDGC